VNYLVDTSVVSELTKPNPNLAVVGRLKSIENHRLFLSVITLGELEKGIARLPDSNRKEQLTNWLEQQLISQFEGRLLGFGQDCARRWGRIQEQSGAQGNSLPAIDSMIAATALVHDLVVITRNGTEIERCGAKVLNPWPRTG